MRAKFARREATRLFVASAEIRGRLKNVDDVIRFVLVVEQQFDAHLAWLRGKSALETEKVPVSTVITHLEIDGHILRVSILTMDSKLRSMLGVWIVSLFLQPATDRDHVRYPRCWCSSRNQLNIFKDIEKADGIGCAVNRDRFAYQEVLKFRHVDPPSNWELE